MIGIDEFQKMLQDIADSMPEIFFERLNGGILLIPQSKRHPKAQRADLVVMGEYHHDTVYGRYIKIYYGSFSRVFGHLSTEELYTEVERVVKHEFRHHLESQGGVKDLEIWDHEQIARYEREARQREDS